MKNIVVPIDFSEYSISAVKVAADFCRSDDQSNLVLIHIYEKPISGISLQFEIDREALHDVKLGIHKKFDDVIQDHLEGLSVKKIFVSDISVKDILNIDEVKNADLIIMGTQGAVGIKDLIMGSNAQQMVRNANCPVLVIKKSLESFNPKSVIVVSSFMETESYGFSKIKNALQSFNPKYHLLKLFKSDIEEIDEISYDNMVRFVEANGLTSFTIDTRKAPSIEQGTRDYCQDKSADLVVIETYGRKGLDRFMQNSVAEKLVDHLDVPVMTIKIE